MNWKAIFTIAVIAAVTVAVVMRVGALRNLVLGAPTPSAS